MTDSKRVSGTVASRDRIDESGGAARAAAAFPAYERAWRDPVVEQRIAQGIEAHRKGTVSISVIDAEGRRVPDAAVHLTQVSHAFAFGANGFMVGGFEDPDRNGVWEQRFARLFNTTTAPFYWKDFEPEPGRCRISEDSVPIYRRPPPERVLSFARRWGLTTKGHTLVWKQPEIALPAYWPFDPAAQRDLIDRRIAFLAERFGDTIGVWDVVNEVVHSSRRFDAKLMPDDYVAYIFGVAARAFPKTTKLILNEATPEAWDELADEATPLYLLAASLIGRGARIDAIGLQMHFFSESEIERTLAGELRTPATLFAALDLYARLGRPVHVTEVTVPALPAYGGDALQADLARNLYRLWFSHPAVEAITWWNLADGTALASEDQWAGGLLGQDGLGPKPAYLALDELINREWRSEVSLVTNADGQAETRVFHGLYTAEVVAGERRWRGSLDVTPGPARAVALREA